MMAILLFGSTTLVCGGVGGGSATVRVGAPAGGVAGFCCATAAVANTTRSKLRKRGFLIMIFAHKGLEGEAPGEFKVYIQLMAVMELRLALPPRSPGSSR